MPAVEKDGEQLVKRDVEDLDKSVRELVTEGKIEVRFDPSQRPPKGLTVRVDGDALDITVTKKGMPVVGSLIGLAIPAVFIYIGFFVDDIEAETAKLASKGFKITQSAETPTVIWAYYGTDAVGGVSIELMQKKPE